MPNHCIGCAKTLFGGERVLCMSCYHDLDFIPTNEQAVHELIQHQLYGKIALKKACGLLYYDKDKGITQKLVKSLKYRGREDIGDFLAELSWEKFKNTSLFDDVDFIQVGARNMQNFELLKELGRMDKPILLKRGLSSTLQELLMSAEYIMSEGNEKVVLCERGIRTFETATRNTLDLSAIPLLKELTHLPIIIDPSHATGIARLVRPMAIAAAAAGADGLMIEVHNDPPHALCDGVQSLTPEVFAELVQQINSILPFACKYN